MVLRLPISSCLYRHRDRRAGVSEASELELSFDCPFIDDRPDFVNLRSLDFLEYILVERHAFTVYIESEKHPRWRTVEVEPARYIRRIGN